MTRAASIAPVALAAVALTAACANVGARRAEDVERAARRAGAVSGTRVVAAVGTHDDGSIAPRALELLQGELLEDEAVEIALLNHRGVRAAFERLGVSSAQAARATRPANPVLSAEWLEFDAG
ncbi:MAG: hypothetical protein EPO68_10845, partial [Planctomycetota bacterium]